MLEILLALAFGTVLGIVCGLLPGIHPNTLIPILAGASFLFEPLSAGIILVAAGIANSFVAFIPSVLLGAPESESALAVLPGHRLLLQGRGYEAIKLTVIGGLFSVVFVLLTLPLFVLFVPHIYNFIRPNIHFVLAAVVIYMIASEKLWREKAFALAVFILSGILGIITLKTFSSEILFPLLTGLFGLPLLFMSIYKKVKLQESVTFEEELLPKKLILSSSVIGSLAGVLAGLLPGIGSAQATVLAQEATGVKNERAFLMAIAGVNIIDVIYSLLAIWLIGNPRSGIAVAVSEMINVGLKEILIFISVIIAVSGLAAYLTLKISRRFLFAMRRIDYQRLCTSVFVFLLATVFAFSGLYGLVVACVALAIGLIPNLVGIRRSHAMGCLILPTILFFAGI